jgi:hypothetical protein
MNVEYEAEGGPEEIAMKIFTKPPKAKCSIQLHLEEETAMMAQQSDAEEFIFNILSIITFKGVEILFGHKDIFRLTEENIDLLQSYVNSYGYRITREYMDSKLLIGFEKVY